MIRVGFTGTARGMTDAQKATVDALLLAYDGEEVREFHFGLCVGADDEAAQLAAMRGFRLVAHPGPDPARRGRIEPDETRPALPFLERNTNIVRETSVVIAAPRGFKEELRSGTWATIRRARKHQRTLWIVYPDGSLSTPLYF